jgi:hypothetical protein
MFISIGYVLGDMKRWLILLKAVVDGGLELNFKRNTPENHAMPIHN